MERWNELKEELEILNQKSLKGKSTLESAKVLSDIDNTNKKDDMFLLLKNCTTFQKKPLTLQNSQRQPVDMTPLILKM